MQPNQNNPYGHYQQNQGPYPSNMNNQNQYGQMPNPNFSQPYGNPNYQQPYPPYPQNQTGMHNSNPYNNNLYGNPYNNNPYNNNPYNNNPFGNSQNSQPMNYHNQGFSNQSFAMQIINNYADSIFDKHDQNRSGQLDVREIYPAVSELFGSNGLPPPNYQQVLNIMKQFDTNGDGLINKGEFRTLLMRLSN